jgi:putative nucleotidyltransferase with HDIG domain
MFQIRKPRARRVEIRKNRPDITSVKEAVTDGRFLSLVAVVVVFWIGAAFITMLREQVVRYRPDDFAHEDITSRVDFYFTNTERLVELQQAAREAAPRVYRPVANPFADLQKTLLALPEDVNRLTPEQLPKPLRLDTSTITALKQIADSKPTGEEYKKWVAGYISKLTEARDRGDLIVLDPEEWQDERLSQQRDRMRVLAPGPAGDFLTVDRTRTAPARQPASTMGELQRGELLAFIQPIAEQHFSQPAANIAGYTVDTLKKTHELDKDLTLAEQDAAAKRVSVALARRHILEKAVLVPKGQRVTEESWRLLNEEQKAFVEKLGLQKRIWAHLGMAGIVFLVTCALTGYIVLFQPRILRNRFRAVAIVALLLAMLLLPQLAAVGVWPLPLFGIAPTILVAMILAIAYDQRFALGIASLHGLLVTAALGQGIGFFLIMWVGILTCCFLLEEVRTRSKLVEVGGMTAIAMIFATAAVSAANMEPIAVLWRNSMFAGAAGLGVGFIVLGILPFIEKAFKITTSISLLELADASHPLLRRLAVEAPGTYTHSLQVATLAEAAAEAVGANSLLCRVGSYYHDIGKMNKADYFVENQVDGRNRHLNLTPSVSLLIIIGHVKDGVEMAREYNLPPVIQNIIQQHHGTTLVEYFYHQACKNCGDDEQPPDVQYRYPGPKPRSRETAVVMIADCVESASRAIVEPTANRIETLVHELVMKRLLDGQFDEADLTFSELQLIEKTLVKSLLAIYHGRLAYPSTAALTQGAVAAATTKVG